MTVVLAAIDDSAAADPVLRAAGALARALGASLHALHVEEDGGTTATALTARAGVPTRLVRGNPTREILRAAADPSVVALAVGTRDQPAGPRPAGHITLELVEGVDKAILVVPPEADGRAPTRPLRRVLFPLEGASATSEAVAGPLRRLRHAGVEVLALHVFDAVHVPSFWDQPAHAEEGFAAEFRARWCEAPTTPLRLRSGSPPDAVLEVARAEDVDLIALAWSQHLTAGRADVVRAVLTHSHVPVLLLPVGEPSASTGSEAGAVGLARTVGSSSAEG